MVTEEVIFFSLEICQFVSVVDFLSFSIGGSHFLPPKNRMLVHKNQTIRHTKSVYWQKHFWNQKKSKANK